MKKYLALGLFALPSVAFAQSSQGDVAITIYSDQALVVDKRVLSLSSGEIKHEFRDVSAQIRPETVSLTGDGIDIAEQNFDFDLLSPAKLMEKSEGQMITLIRQNSATGKETSEQAKVLAVNGGVVMQVGGKIEVLRDDGQPVRVIFDKIPPNLRSRPTLSVTFDSAKAGTRPLTLSYLTSGLSWKSDYVGLFNEQAETIDLQGWVTLSNTTGTPFPNATLTLAAGAGSEFNQRRGRRGSYSDNAGTESSGNDMTLGDLHLYQIQGGTNVATNQQKQISFLDTSGIAAKRAYSFTNPWLSYADFPRSAESLILLNTGKQAGLGRALPAGTMRIYMRDKAGKSHFIGESQIGHTTAGSDLAISTGQAFDVKVRPILESREAITEDVWKETAKYRIASDAQEQTVTVSQKREFTRTKMRYIFTNARNVPVTVKFKQDGLQAYSRASRIPEESIKGETDGFDARVWQVTVPANGKTELTATFITDF